MPSHLTLEGRIQSSESKSVRYAQTVSRATVETAAQSSSNDICPRRCGVERAGYSTRRRRRRHWRRTAQLLTCIVAGIFILCYHIIILLSCPSPVFGCLPFDVVILTRVVSMLLLLLLLTSISRNVMLPQRRHNTTTRIVACVVVSLCPSPKLWVRAIAAACDAATIAAVFDMRGHRRCVVTAMRVSVTATVPTVFSRSSCTPRRVLRRHMLMIVLLVAVLLLVVMVVYDLWRILSSTAPLLLRTRERPLVNCGPCTAAVASLSLSAAIFLLLPRWLRLAFKLPELAKYNVIICLVCIVLETVMFSQERNKLRAWPVVCNGLGRHTLLSKEGSHQLRPDPLSLQRLVDVEIEDTERFHLPQRRAHVTHPQKEMFPPSLQDAQHRQCLLAATWAADSRPPRRDIQPVWAARHARPVRDARRETLCLTAASAHDIDDIPHAVSTLCVQSGEASRIPSRHANAACVGVN